MRKTLWACIAASALSLAFTATSFAAVQYGESNEVAFTYDEENNQITITDTTLATKCGEDATILVLKPITGTTVTDGDILYIAQEKTASADLSGLGLREAIESGKTYTLKIGGTNITSADAILEGTFGLKTTPSAKTEVKFVWGDVTGDNSVDLSDAGAMLNYEAVGATKQYENSPYAIASSVTELEKADGTKITFTWGDITGDSSVDLSDAGAALNYEAVGATKQYENSPYAIAAEVKLYK